MTQPTQAAVEAIALVVRGIPGILSAPDYPPDQANYSPMAITYVADGILGNGPIGTRMDLWSVAIDLLIPARKLDDDIQTLTPFLDLVPAALQAQVSGTGACFAGTIQEFEKTRISYLLGTDYAGVPMRGYRFMMLNVKILVAT